MLNANVEAADPGTDKHSIMLHLYTRAQEEFEKKADPARALVHKLCRQPDAQIRDNILRTYLAPQTELIAPDATRIPLEKPMPPSNFAFAVFGRRGVDRRAAAGFRCGWRFQPQCQHRVLPPGRHRSSAGRSWSGGTRTRPRLRGGARAAAEPMGPPDACSGQRNRTVITVTLAAGVGVAW